MPKKSSLPTSFSADKALKEIFDRLHVDNGANVDDFLALRFGKNPNEFLDAVLKDPIKDMTRRPGKKIRARLVEMGYRLAFPKRLIPSQTNQRVEKIAEAIEFLHAGSLAVDDVQDGSKIRRGKPTLHLQYGMPVALNAGNFLYFWALEKIRSIGLPPDIELKMYQAYNRTLTRAHMGQALDVGVTISSLSQEKIPPVCFSAMELKSGALFSLALILGAVAGGADQKTIDALDEFGHGFGVALQMFDDLGNLKGHKEPMKKWEDLHLRRPTFVWACAALYPKKNFQQFLTAVRQLPNERRLLRWLDQNRFFETAKGHGRFHMNKCHRSLRKNFADRPCAGPFLSSLHSIGEEIINAY